MDQQRRLARLEPRIARVDLFGAREECPRRAEILHPQRQLAGGQQRVDVLRTRPQPPHLLGQLVGIGRNLRVERDRGKQQGERQKA